MVMRLIQPLGLRLDVAANKAWPWAGFFQPEVAIYPPKMGRFNHQRKTGLTV
jgi:hypothetical protein